MDEPIIVLMDGGVITAVCRSGAPIPVVVIDWDVDPLDDPEAVPAPDPTGEVTVPAYVAVLDALEEPNEAIRRFARSRVHRQARWTEPATLIPAEDGS